MILMTGVEFMVAFPPQIPDFSTSVTLLWFLEMRTRGIGWWFILHSHSHSAEPLLFAGLTL